MAKHGAVEHWAKIEVPSRAADLDNVRARLAARYPLERFAAVRWVGVRAMVRAVASVKVRGKGPGQRGRGWVEVRSKDRAQQATELSGRGWQHGQGEPLWSEPPPSGVRAAHARVPS